MTSESIYNSFKPTYLMIKQHKITGLKYLCKTTSNDPIKYKGSGKRWVRHIKKYGKEHVITLWYKLYTNREEISRIAIALSEMYDIVDSISWANLVPENGLDGGSGHRISSEFAKELAHKRLGNGTHNFLTPGHSKNVQDKLVIDGVHHFLDGSRTKERNLVLSNRILYKEVYKMYKDRGIKIPSGTYMRSDEILLNIKNQLLDIPIVDIQPVYNKINKINVLDGSVKKELARRSIYKEVRDLYKKLNMKIPNNTFMRRESYLIDLKESLINKL